MFHAIERLVEQYGIVAIFLGCLFEGEAAAIIGGFLVHQAMLPAWQAVIAAFLGTSLANIALFVAGRRLGERAFVRRLREKPGFSHALAIAGHRPRAFVFFNRFVYGMRLIAGTVAGLADIPWRVFLPWNFFSALVWAASFVGIGYFFGLGAEAVAGRALRSHQRLVIGAAILVGVLVLAFAVAKRVKRREAKLMDPAPGPRDGGSAE